jgi:tetratricopeptide (TPR) repeat protein
VLALLVAVVYSNTLGNSFHLDDYYRIEHNPGITQVWPLWRHFLDPATMSSLKSIQQFRPLLPLTLSLNYALFGLAPLSYHLCNLVAHFAAVAFFYLFFLVLLTDWSPGWLSGSGARGAALGAGAIFAVHPISGFPVNYLCALDLLMMQAALGGALYCYVRMRRQGETPGRWALVLMLFLTALLAKTSAVVMVPVVFLFETLVAKERPLSRGLWRRVLPLVLVVGLLLLFTRVVLNFSDLDQALADGGLSWGYLLTQIKLHLFHYLRNLVWPFEIRGMPYVPRVETIWDPKVLLALTVIGASVAAAWLARRRAPVLAFAVFAYWATMAPETSFLPLHHLAADYRGYAALPYLALVLTMLLCRYLPARVAPLALAVLVGYFGVSAYVMNRHYLDEQSFWAQSVRYGGDEVANMNYAMCFRSRDPATAGKYLEEAVKINPTYYLGNINLGLYYLDQGEKQKGLELVRRGVEYSPQSCLDRALYWQAIAYERVGDYPQAHDAIVRALEYNHQDLESLYEAAFIAQALGKYAEALGYLAAVHRQEANVKISRFMAGWCQQKLGRHPEAVAEYQLALKYTPHYAQTYANLGYALNSLGRFREACGYFEKFLQMDPGNRPVKAALETCRKSAQNQ